MAESTNGAGRETAILAGGCFWCLEAVYDELRGVESVESGYTAGQVPNPSYEAVCSGRTGHAEAVRLVFDPSAVSFETILKIFFTIHDPTTLNYQGNDHGTQYRSGIYYTSEEQKRVAEDVIREITAEGLYPNPVVTEVVPASEFYVAEDYHQEYFVNNQNAAYCAYVVAPKVKKFRDKYLSYMKA
jgi:peptide-methionine (S)-S-oxide reductase